MVIIEEFEMGYRSQLWNNDIWYVVLNHARNWICLNCTFYKHISQRWDGTPLMLICNIASFIVLIICEKWIIHFYVITSYFVYFVPTRGKYPFGIHCKYFAHTKTVTWLICGIDLSYKMRVCIMHNMTKDLFSIIVKVFLLSKSVALIPFTR